MNVRPARLGVLLVVVALMATAAPPASATTVKLLVFTADWRLDKGLGYPCTTNKATCPPGITTTTKTGPKGEPEVNITTTGGLHAGYDFRSSTCLKASFSTPDKITQKNGFDACLITSTGAIWGWCGLSELFGTANFENLTSGKDTFTSFLKGTEVAGVYYIRGGGPQTNIYIVMVAVEALPAAGVGSCTNKTGTVFTLTGTAIYKNVTSM